MITIIYQFNHNVMWHCKIIFFSFPEQLQIWINVFLVGDHRYVYICSYYVIIMFNIILSEFSDMYE